MFAPHTAQVEIERTEPVGLNVDLAVEKVLKRHAMVSWHVVTLDRLKTRPQDPKAARERITRAWEADERVKFLKPFIESWNKWREYYAPADRTLHAAWLPKSSASITVCESIVDFAKEEDLDLDLLIASGHKAFERSRYPLALTSLLANALDYYARYADDVRVDVDTESYKISASDEWDAESY